VVEQYILRMACGPSPWPAWLPSSTGPR
jgi:hypothetical protein